MDINECTWMNEHEIEQWNLMNWNAQMNTNEWTWINENELMKIYEWKCGIKCGIKCKNENVRLN